MNIPMYKDGEMILVHPTKVDWMEQAGWAAEDKPETENNDSNREVEENGSNNGA